MLRVSRQALDGHSTARKGLEAEHGRKNIKGLFGGFYSGE